MTEGSWNPSSSGICTWASYQIRKNCGLRIRPECWELFPRHRLKRKPLVSHPDMHHGTCVMHVPWRMWRWREKTFPAFPAHAQPAILRICWCSGDAGSQEISNHEVDLLHKYQNATAIYPSMHHFVKGICTCVHISITKWCIVGYLTNALWELWDRSDDLVLPEYPGFCTRRVQ